MINNAQVAIYNIYLSKDIKKSVIMIILTMLTMNVKNMMVIESRKLVLKISQQNRKMMVHKVSNSKLSTILMMNVFL